MEDVASFDAVVGAPQRVGLLDVVADTQVVAFETALGRCGLRWSEAGITGVLMPGEGELQGQLTEPSASLPPQLVDAAARIVALLDGEPDDLRSIVLDERRLDPFNRRVYAAARDIAPGSIASYGEIARAIAMPDGARAVGGALAGNPFPIIVPCHRVLAANGALHGFSAPGGIATKRRMLEIERAPGFTQQALFS